MKTNTVTVKTITIGLKAKKLLTRRGMKAALVKLDSSKAANGCQYGIKFNERNYYDVIAVLREEGIEYGTYNEK